jgi:zinc-binding in reverse transcriptase
MRIPNKVKIFLWLLLRDRLLTNVNLCKRSWPCGTTYVLCARTLDEDTEHLFLRYTYARRIWNDILPNNAQPPQTLGNLANLLQTTRTDHTQQNQSIAPSCWNIWKEWNRRFFQSTWKPPERLLMQIVQDLSIWVRIWSFLVFLFLYLISKSTQTTVQDV